VLGSLRPPRNVKMPKLDARKSGSFMIGGEIGIHRLGFGAMRVTGPGIWGPPVDRAEAIRTLKRITELGIDFIDTAETAAPASSGPTKDFTEYSGAHTSGTAFRVEVAQPG
jgi:hypothetical protein